jgi:hypothetical protein
VEYTNVPQLQQVFVTTKMTQKKRGSDEEPRFYVTIQFF